MMGFKSVMIDPPNGEFYFEHGGERISAPTWSRFLPLMRDLQRRHHLAGSPYDLAARHMCPHLPSWYCTEGGVRVTSTETAKANAAPLFPKHVVTPVEIQRRMDVCRTCPKHVRTACLTCTGAARWIYASFGGRRPRLPEDRMSGMCACADTYEAVVASVDARELPAWKDVPETCWRKSK